MGFLGNIFETIFGAFNIIWAALCVPVYIYISRFFNLFITIAELDLLSNTNMNEIYKRVTMIITIVMTFYVVFSIVKYVISPDTVGDKEKGAGKIAYRIVIAILLIAFVPDMFSIAYKIQNRLIESQVFSKVILGNEAIDYTSYGRSFAADTFSAFYRVDLKNCGNECDKAQEHVSDVIEGIRSGTGGTFNILSTIGGQFGWSLTGHTVSPGAVEFDGLLALIFGCYALYAIFLYCFDVAVRYVQLLYLQIIAPIAIMGYIVPSKENMFQKWWKQCLSTYLDLFIRISIMYFAMLILQVLGHSMGITQMTSDGENLHFQFPIFNDGTGAFRVYIFFIMGVLIFIQRAPKLIGELLPKGGTAGIGFGLEWKTRGDPLKKSFNAIKKPIATTAGAVASTISTAKSLKSGKLKEALAGKFDGSHKHDTRNRRLNSAYILGKAAINGGKDAAKSNSIFGAYTNRDKQEQAARDIISKGGTPVDHDLKGLHFENLKANFKKYLDDLDAVVKSKKTVKDSGAELKTNKAAQSFISDWNEKGLGDPTARTQFGKDIEKVMNVYARSDKSTDAYIRATNAIAKAINDTKIYTNETEKSAALASILRQFDKDKDSTEIKILKQNLDEAQKIAFATKNMDGDSFKYVINDVDFSGNKRNIDLIVEANKIKAMPDTDPNKAAMKAWLDKTFAEHLGDIEKLTTEEIVETQYSDEYKAANANANVPGKKDQGN